MKTFLTSFFVCGAFFCVASFSIQTLIAEPAGEQKAESVLANTNSASEIPKSIFDDKEGKDPFFPSRSRVPQGATNAIPTNLSDFMIQGITKGDKPTVIINTKTFEVGEADEVRTRSGSRVTIRLIEIKQDSILIKIGDSSTPLELKIPPGKF